MTSSPTASFSANIFISLKACLRFLSKEFAAWLLLSQILTLSMVCFMGPDSEEPEASLFEEPITVERPISNEVIDVGIPVLALLSPPCSSWNDLHSGFVSSSLSFTT